MVRSGSLVNRYSLTGTAVRPSGSSEIQGVSESKRSVTVGLARLRGGWCQIGCDEGEDALQDADVDAGDGAAAVLFEVELTL